MKKKRTVEELEEGEVGPQKGVKQQRKTREPNDKRAPSMESRDEAELRQGQRSWAPHLKVEGAPIPWDATLWESQRGHANILAEILEQPFLLPRDMEGLRQTRQPDLFMLLKRDITLVSWLTLISIEYFDVHVSPYNVQI